LLPSLAPWLPLHRVGCKEPGTGKLEPRVWCKELGTGNLELGGYREPAVNREPRV
jgi:hypothetical protein